MRLILFPLLALILGASAAAAQSIGDNLPGGGDQAVPAAAPVPGTLIGAPGAPAASPVPDSDPYSVADVNADVTADTAAHARDQALMQAERAALPQLLARLGLTGVDAGKMSDDTVAALVQSFEVQSEHLSAVRYIGVFTIRFSPAAVRKLAGGAAVVTNDAAAHAADAVPAGPVAHLPVTVETGSLAVWNDIRRRLGTVAPIARIDVVSLGRGSSRIDLTYTGAIEDLQKALNNAGFVLLQGADGGWELDDGSMEAR